MIDHIFVLGLLVVAQELDHDLTNVDLLLHGEPELLVSWGGLHQEVVGKRGAEPDQCVLTTIKA